jgi:hypothetical protein
MSRACQGFATILLGLFTLAATAGSARAQESGPNAIEGVWAMSLTLRDCATGAALGPPFRSLLTFHSGGTLSESAGTTQFAAGQRSPGHGVWSFEGDRTFTARFIAMVLFDTPPAPPAPGFQTGWLVVGSNFTLVDDTRLNIAASAQFFDSNRNLYRSACPTGAAEKFQ